MARNEAGLRWSVVTIDEGDDAKDALDRITIPQDVLDRIAPTAMPRSSIIVSDEPLSAETNYRTEFVAVLSNQPQGGFITRQPTNDILVENDSVRDDGFGFFQRGWNSQTGFRRNWDSQANPRRSGGQDYYRAQQGWGWQ
ncbi:MAG: L,D-transpeptidase, partial [Xanthobacteraceae bacterium]